ncbi:hypothetical protein CFN78_26240 [Amycolatopsis antarctica]|uniref:DUF2631 domain-containing protein n=1 Tax=Amycolatopsis antarctica TaxID=1854586 RepID=A0A263CVU0_9PSEU|nr:DUF2631 domain-containing protein [Amycolatopsis antarctica]OZM70221.1 hypothetical protein CFN78_26240 [Amycolatopsis antarctica]
MAGKAVEKQQRADVGAVDPRDEPSAEWGWHGTFPKATRIAAWFSALALFLMLIGNHVNAMEDIWLIGLGVSLVATLLWDIRRGRTSWRR